MSSCGTRPVLVKTKVIVVTPPEQYLQEEPVPKIPDKMLNKELMEFAADVLRALRNANSKLRNIRKFTTEREKYNNETK